MVPNQAVIYPTELDKPTLETGFGSVQNVQRRRP